MVELGDIAARRHGAPDRADSAQADARAASARALPPLASVSRAGWNALAERAVEPNGYYLADWERAVSAFAEGRTGASALTAFAAPAADSASAAALVGLLPVVSTWQAHRLPLPVLVNADPYGTLGTPLLDRDSPADAAHALLDHARRAGARALLLRDVALDGEALAAFAAALRRDGLRPRLLSARARACSAPAPAPVSTRRGTPKPCCGRR